MEAASGSQIVRGTMARKNSRWEAGSIGDKARTIAKGMSDSELANFASEGTLEILTKGETKGGKGKPKSPHEATIYDGPKNNVVFNAGTIWWAQGLSSPPGHVLPAHKKQAQPQGPDSRVQRMMANVFERFIK